jgi:hypothetical protein
MGSSDEDSELAANVEIIRSGLAARIATLKAEVERWAEDRASPGNGGAITAALPSVAIERQLRLTNEADARDFILGVFNKIVRGSTPFQ